MPSSGKSLVFVALLLVFNLTLLELMAFAFTRLNRNLFRPEQSEIAAMVDAQRYEDFLSSTYHPTKGWQMPRGQRVPGKSCLGKDIAMTFDVNGARVADPVVAPKIMTVGDSFTVGWEVGDQGTYPNQLQNILGAEVVNYGVGAYGPLQAVLQFEEQIVKHPSVTTAILGIMYENILRMVNSYRPVLHRRTQERFGFKPYVKVTGVTVAHVANRNTPPRQAAPDLLDLMLRAYDEDYWYRPRSGFPYLLSVYQVFANRTSRLKFRERLNLFFGTPQYAQYFAQSDFRLGLQSVIQRFADAAKNHGVRPLIAFLPRSAADRSSARPLIAAMTAEHPDVVFIDVGAAEIDWQRYTEKLNCHPSSYGYRKIAEAIAHHF